MRRVLVLLHALPLARRCPLRDRLGEELHELAHARALVERERGQVRRAAQCRARLPRRYLDDRERVDLHDRVSCADGVLGARAGERVGVYGCGREELE